MTWRGRPPEEGGKLPPGEHRVTLERTVDLDSGDVLAVLGNEAGEVTVNINPDLNDRKHSWRFWRLVGAFDYPTPDYWAKPTQDREERDWNVFQILREIAASKKECLVVVVEKVWQGKTLANVADMKSVVRHGSLPATQDNEVPF